ncbi:hypothetical protein MAR_035226 [Mya arenaria]|uniref:Uncharacterized protein n=1 Tax=Mya arenaria TaxID=6604 RepID=A0ABY7ELR5_MYAAR|nr:hypothetical protein MAR_035226 [Mya arenaria]
MVTVSELTIITSGTEYTLYPHYQSSPLPQFFGSNIVQEEAHCAICKVIRGTLIMIPGQKDCYPGWTKEYSGYLVGGYPGYGDSTHCHGGRTCPPYVNGRELSCDVCSNLSEIAEKTTIRDGPKNTLLDRGKFQHENVLYFIEADCIGSLTCPAYVLGREISCVVCTNLS